MWFSRQQGHEKQVSAAPQFELSAQYVGSRNVVLHPSSWLLVLRMPLHIPQNSGYYVPAHFPSCVFLDPWSAHPSWLSRVLIQVSFTMNGVRDGRSEG